MKSIIVISIFLLIYGWLTREEWLIRKPCSDCKLLQNQMQQRMIGTVEILPNTKTVFTEQLTGLTYNMIPCDTACDSKELLPFSKSSIRNVTTSQQIYFKLEGKYCLEKQAFIYSSIIALNERTFLNVEKIKSLTFDKIKEHYTALEEKNFLLNETQYTGLREFLPHYFSKEQLKQPLRIKEATWETSDNTLITIWFEQRPNQQNKWVPIEYYEWKKGIEF